MTNALCALMLDPDECAAFAEAIADFKIEYIKKVGKYYPEADVFNFHDDYGTGDRMFMDPDIWRKIFKPQLKRIVDTAHQEGLFFQFHSCGYIEPIIDDLVEIGVDALDPLQICNTNMRTIKDKYQDRLTFCGGFNNQEVFDRAGVTDEECYQESKRGLELLAPGGSYIAYPITITQFYEKELLKALSDYN